MRHLFALVLLGVAASATQDDADFEDNFEFLKFAAKNNKFYSSKEDFELRKQTFNANHEKVKELNSKNSLVRFEDNFTSDLLDDEFAAMMGLDASVAEEVLKSKSKKGLDDDLKGRRLQSTEPFDWVEDGKVSPVKNQGSCGSCWSFSGTLALESAWAIANNTDPVRLSEQEGVDCTTNTTEN